MRHKAPLLSERISSGWCCLSSMNRLTKISISYRRLRKRRLDLGYESCREWGNVWNWRVITAEKQEVAKIPWYVSKIWTSDDITFFHSIEEGTGHRERCWEIKVLWYGKKKTVAVGSFTFRLLFIKCQNYAKIKKFEMDHTREMITT